MDFIWNDGGRAACGFVGLTGDCVPRAIAIATNTVYREVYDALGAASEKSPRLGVRTDIAATYLSERDWIKSDGHDRPFQVKDLPKGIVIVHLVKRNDRAQHFCTIVDRVVHDTWDPSDDDGYLVRSYWTSETAQSDSTLPIVGSRPKLSNEQELTQKEFEKILSRLRALDRTASNGASTEGEKHNALRMMQSLMLRHNLTRDDIVDEDNIEHLQFARIACPVNGSRACIWEKLLASYVTQQIFPTTQWYISTQKHRTLFWFYGPIGDVKNAIALFREILLTIAAAAHLQFGGHSRGSGASYAEGYVMGLPRTFSDSSKKQEQVLSEGALIQSRMLVVHSAAKEWLDIECNIQLHASRRSGRVRHDPEAADRGKLHGSKHEVKPPNAPPRIAQQ